MAKIEWDGSTYDYESGIDRGVLFVDGLAPVAWNGLISATHNSENGEFQHIYVDSVAVDLVYTHEDFIATLSAYTYPDEFEACLGVNEHVPGLFATNHDHREFSLAYRTKLGTDHHKIHILYNCSVGSTDKKYRTTGAEIDPSIFTWGIETVPEYLYNHRPSAHISIATNKSNSASLKWLTDAIYGTEEAAPYLPSADEVLYQFNDHLIVIDHGDGSWTAKGPDRSILDFGDSFTIISPSAEMVDSESYTLTGY